MKATFTPNIADKFVLLFSADWFLPYWKLTGLVPRREEEKAFQEEMRRLVIEMMDEETSYWNVDFSEFRISRTRNGFLSAVGRLHPDESGLVFMREMVASKLSDATLTDHSMAFWDDYEPALDAIRRADLTATEWDRYLASLTPDLPSYLQNFACVDVLRVA